MTVEIAKRVTTQATSGQRRKLFRALVKASSDVVYRMSPDWTEMRYLVGRDFIADTKEPSRTWLNKYVHPDDQPHLLAVIREAIGTKSVFELEHRVIRADGSLGWMFSRAIPVFDANGEITDWFGRASDITKRKQTEVALAESEARFRAIFENAAVGIAQVGPEGNWLRVNERLCSIVGYSAEELMARTFQDITHPDDLETDLAQTARLRAGEIDTYRREKRYVRKDGRIVWVNLTVGCERRADGSVDYFISVIEDITERKNSEEALRESQAQLALAMQRLQSLGTLFLNDGNLNEILGEIVEATIAIAGADMGNIQLLDPATGDLRIVAQRGFPQWWLDYWDSVCRGQGACGTALERGERVIIEDVEKSPLFMATPALDIQRRAGVRAVQSTPLVGPSGHVLGMASTHYRTPHRPDQRTLRLLDLLARQAADIIEHQRAENSIRASEERVRTIVDTATDAIIVIDETGRIESVNPATTRIFGYTPAEMVNRDVSMLMSEPHRLTQDCCARTVLTNDKAKKIGIGREVEARRKDGTLFPADLAVAEWRLEGKRYFSAILRDVTERRRRERQLHELLREVNHRSKNLLAVVQAIASRTAAIADADEFRRTFSKRLAALATSHDLLVQSQWQGVDLATLVRAQVAAFIDQDGQRVALEGPALRVSPTAAQSLGMAVHELTTNAVKYGALSTAGGRVGVTWWLSHNAKSADRFAMAWVEEGGPPVEPPAHRGFGMSVIDVMPRHDLDADVEVDFAMSGLRWRLECPAARVLDERQGSDEIETRRP